jgi:hypothetical protein
MHRKMNSAADRFHVQGGMRILLDTRRFARAI